MKQRCLAFVFVNVHFNFNRLKHSVIQNLFFAFHIFQHKSSTLNQGLPVYFPAPPPHYHMSLERKKKNTFGHEPEIFGDDSRPGSFGIESDRMSNISSELSNILYELQAFDTNAPCDTEEGRSHAVHTNSNYDSTTSELSHSPMSTFRPEKKKSEILYSETKPPSYTDHQRVRLLRGRSRQETDPADGLHSPGSMYSSL